MILNNPFKLCSVQQISLIDSDAIPKAPESVRRANKRGHGMTVFDRLPNDLQPVPPVAPNTTSFMLSLILPIDDYTQ